MAFAPVLGLVFCFVFSACLKKGPSDKKNSAPYASEAYKPVEPSKSVEFDGPHKKTKQKKVPSNGNQPKERRESRHTKTPQKGGRAVVHLAYEPPHLNLFLQEDFWISRIVTNNIQEALLKVDGNTGEILPNLATSWRYSGDSSQGSVGSTVERSDQELRLELTLREGVLFHDGERFGPKDVEFTFQILMDPDRSTPSLRQNFSQVKWFKTEGNTFIIGLKQPDFKLLSSLAHLPILPKHIYGTTADMKQNPATSMPVGTGPFKIQEWNRGKSILLRRHESYWGKTAQLKEILFKIVRDMPKAIQLLKKGEIDFIPRVPLHMACERGQKLWGGKAKSSFRFLRYYPNQFHSIIMNVKTEQLQDRRVRRALAEITPQKIIAESLLCNHARLITGPFWPDRPGYDKSLKRIKYSPKKAGQRLEEAGWRYQKGDDVRSKAGIRLELTYLQIAESSLQKRLCPVLRDTYRRAGVKLNIQKVPFSRWLRLVRNHQFHMTDVLWTFYGEQDLYQHYHCTQAEGGSNYGAYCNPKVDKLLQRIRRTLDREVRSSLERLLHRMLHRDLPAIYLFNTAEVSLASSRLRGCTPNGEGFPWSRMWIDDRNSKVRSKK